MKIEIAIIGEYIESRPSRSMIIPALEHSSNSIGIDMACHWISNEKINDSVIRKAHGVFISPGGACEKIDAIIRAIEVCRTERIPCIGTCGGFQRIVTEYFLNHLKFEKVEHQEASPNAVDPLFSKLKCSLVGESAEVEFITGSLVSSIYRKK